MGLAQGLAEFFPVSSSAHLALIPWIFKITDPGLSFDIALHTGTLFAIVFALKDDWLKIIKNLGQKSYNFEKKLALGLIITTIPGVLAGYFLEKRAETTFRHPLITAATLIIFGIVLYAIDRFSQKTEKIEAINPTKALSIGLWQAIAIVPGVSRSGATIAGGRMAGFSREAAAKYSFLAALPIILGATVYGLKDIPLTELFSVTWVAGFIAALISSFWAIKFLLRYLKTNNFNIFVLYRFALAIVVIILYLLRN